MDISKDMFHLFKHDLIKEKVKVQECQSPHPQETSCVSGSANVSGGYLLDMLWEAVPSDLLPRTDRA